MKTVVLWLRKWLLCSWLHRHDRCYPVVWGEEDANEFVVPHKPNYWHCRKCHPCVPQWMRDKQMQE